MVETDEQVRGRVRWRSWCRVAGAIGVEVGGFALGLAPVLHVLASGVVVIVLELTTRGGP